MNSEEKNKNCQMTPSPMAMAEKLEFNEILKILSTFCKTYIGKNMALTLIPDNNAEIVQNLLNETRRSCKFKLQKFFS